MKQVLLLETFNAESERHHRAEYFPFLAGLFADLGWRSAWRVVRVPPETMHVGGRFVVDLPEELRAALAAETRAIGPALVVCHDRPAAGLAAVLREAAPGAEFVDLTAFAEGGREPIGWDVRVPDVLAAFGLPPDALPDTAGPDGEPGLLIDRERLSFERRFVGAPQEDLAHLQVRLAAPIGCSYRRRLEGNPLFEGLDSPLVKEHRGCSFCPADKGHEVPLRTPIVELVFRQVEAHQRAHRPPPGGRFSYVLDDTPLNRHLDRFLAAVSERALAPSRFITMLRADSFLRLHEKLAGVLPTMEERGHGLKLVSIGAENFSALENQRFNKGVGPEGVWECFEGLRSMTERFPDTFVAEWGYFAAILFTPWSRPEDLLDNVRAAREIGAPFLRRAIGTRLQLWDALPLSELARRDGLLTDRFGSVGDIVPEALSSPDTRELPWRFADPRVERIHALLIRLDPKPAQSYVPEDDPLRRAVLAAQSGLPGAIARDYVALVEGVIEAVVELGVDADAAAVVARAGALARPTGGGSEAPTTDDGTPRLAGDAWPHRLLRSMADGEADRLQGFRPDGCYLERTENRLQLVIRFLRDGAPFVLCLDDLADETPAWRRGTRFSAVYRGDLPEDPRDETQLAREVLTVFDRDAPDGGIAALGR